MKRARINLLCAAAVAVSGVAVLSGCHSHKHNYSYYSYQQPAAAGGTGAATGTQTMAAGQNQVEVPLYEESVKVGKREVDAGGVRIRKEVTTETVNQPLQLRKETLTIDRLPAQGQGTSAQSSGQSSSAQATSGQGASAQGTSGQSAATAQQGTQIGQPFQAGEIVIHLQNEEPVIEKQVTQSGKIVAQKKSDTQQMTVKEQVRKEKVDIDKMGNPQGVTLSQNLQSEQPREAAGGTPAPSGQQSGTATSGTITDLNKLTQATDKAAMEGRDARLSNVTVRQVVSQRFLIVGDDSNQLVIKAREPIANIQAGDKINVSGQVQQFTETTQLQGPEQTLMLQKTKLFIDAPRVEKAE